MVFFGGLKREHAAHDCNVHLSACVYVSAASLNSEQKIGASESNFGNQILSNRISIFLVAFGKHAEHLELSLEGH